MEIKRGITILGAGNLAWHLGIGLYKAGIPINGIFNRSVDNANQLAKKIDAPYFDNYNAIPKDTSLVIICVSDDAVPAVAEQLDSQLPVVHTSGSLSIELLSSKFKESGVFYPFQTFSKGVNPGELSFPICLEANGNSLKPCLEEVAGSISDKVVWLDSKKRKQLHLSGVMVNNFTNHLITRAFDRLEKDKIDKDLILPILEETIRKVKTNNPAEVQTGPARRKNIKTIEDHLQLLSDDKQLQELYNVMSQSILEYYS